MVKTYGEEMSARLGEIRSSIKKHLRNSAIHSLVMIIALIALVVFDNYRDAAILALAWIALSIAELSLTISGSMGCLAAVYGLKTVHTDALDKQNRERTHRIEAALRAQQRRNP